LPFFLGTMTERFGDKHEPVTEEPAATSACCDEDGGESPPEQQHFSGRVISGLRWGYLELGPTIGFYLAIGILLAGALSASIPPEWSERYLGADSVFGLLAAALLGASIYVCAVAHIPLVATLLASGAGPGAAIVFLVTGTATNLPELFALYKTIGKRTVVIYTTSLVVSSLLAGVCVNLWLGTGFTPVFDPLASLDLIETGERLWVSPGALVNTLAAGAVAVLAIRGCWLRFRRRFLASGASDDSGCCSGD
ncbi:MAG: permease, partial [Gammaproteobacteria bacterium]|nr:permease [Gammaproteobacteria bacterium]